MYNRRLRKIENGIGKKDPDLLDIPELEEYKVYKNMLWNNPLNRFVLKVSRPVMYYFNICNVDISDKRCILSRIRNRHIYRLRSRGIISNLKGKNSEFIDSDTVKKSENNAEKNI